MLPCQKMFRKLLINNGVLKLEFSCFPILLSSAFCCLHKKQTSYLGHCLAAFFGYDLVWLFTPVSVLKILEERTLVIKTDVIRE